MPGYDLLVPDRQIILAPFESDLEIVVLGDETVDYFSLLVEEG